ncbi:MAG: HNH endonuclease [Deltaproteobacteria bacterium]|nr:HNH endonuclease [Deltaproteobacteria bacterium]
MILSICPVCGEQKDIYDETCGNSCAGKLKWERSEKLNSPWMKASQTPEVKKKRAISVGKAQRGKPRPERRGENNPNWKGGIYGTERHREMGRVEYINWRIAIFERDGYKCQICSQVGGDLNAHHIKSWKDFPELRLDVDNGITLCVECHKKVHRKRGK